MNTVVTIFTIGFLVALHELGHLVAARRMGMRVLRYSIGFFKAIASWTSSRSGITYQVGALPLGGFVQIRGMNPFEEGARTDPESYLSKPAWRRAVVLAAGPVSNFLIAWVILFALFASSGNPEPVDEAGVGFVDPSGPAAKAGIKAGDEIRAVNGEKVVTWSDLVGHIEANPGREIMLDVSREGGDFLVAVKPKDLNGVGKLGIGQPQETVTLPVHLAALNALLKCREVLSDTLVSLGRIVTGRESDVQAVGPVGIVKMASTALDVSLVAFLAFIAYLSLMLFLFNFLPLPALDGGRVLFLLFEVIARRPINPRVDVIINSTGFFLLIGLLILMTVRDVVAG